MKAKSPDRQPQLASGIVIRQHDLRLGQACFQSSLLSSLNLLEIEGDTGIISPIPWRLKVASSLNAAQKDSHVPQPSVRCFEAKSIRRGEIIFWGSEVGCPSRLPNTVTTARTHALALGPATIWRNLKISRPFPRKDIIDCPSRSRFCIGFIETRAGCREA